MLGLSLFKSSEPPIYPYANRNLHTPSQSFPFQLAYEQHTVAFSFLSFILPLVSNTYWSIFFIS